MESTSVEMRRRRCESELADLRQKRNKIAELITTVNRQAMQTAYSDPGKARKIHDFVKKVQAKDELYTAKIKNLELLLQQLDKQVTNSGPTKDQLLKAKIIARDAANKIDSVLAKAGNVNPNYTMDKVGIDEEGEEGSENFNVLSPIIDKIKKAAVDRIMGMVDMSPQSALNLINRYLN